MKCNNACKWFSEKIYFWCFQGVPYKKNFWAFVKPTLKGITYFKWQNPFTLHCLVITFWRLANRNSYFSLTCHSHAYCFGKNQQAWEHLSIQFLWATAWLLITCFSLIYLVDEFFFLFLLLNNMRKLGKSKVSSVNQWNEGGRWV